MAITPPKRVLIVDSNLDNRALLAQMLRVVTQESGIILRAAGSAMDAFAEVVTEMPDIVFISQWLPGITCWDVARQVREMGREPDRQPTIVVMTTSPPDPKDMAEINAIELALPIAKKAVGAIIKAAM